MSDEYKIVTVRYGIGYGEHKMDIYVAPDASQDEIENAAWDSVQERLWVHVPADAGRAALSAEEGK